MPRRGHAQHRQREESCGLVERDRLIRAYVPEALYDSQIKRFQNLVSTIERVRGPAYANLVSDSLFQGHPEEKQIKEKEKYLRTIGKLQDEKTIQKKNHQSVIATLR